MFGFGRAWASCLYVNAHEDHPQHKATSDKDYSPRFVCGSTAIQITIPPAEKYLFFLSKRGTFQSTPCVVCKCRPPLWFGSLKPKLYGYIDYHG